MLKKDIVLFGTGKYFENYMICFGQQDGGRPLLAVDNDPAKAGSTKCGVPIRTPDALRDMKREEFYVVICAARHEEIGKQLEGMGIMDYQYHRLVPVDDTIPMELVDGELKPAHGAIAVFGNPADVSDSLVAVPGSPTAVPSNPTAVPGQNDEVIEPVKPYRIGYVPGVFDLFHIGHLNLLRNAKSRCEYLIAGVLTDELVEHFKKRSPVIPYTQRAAIVAAISCVDRVVPVDFSNTRKIDAWKRYHYDCHFSANDHGADWTKDLQELRAVGSNMEFFEYTKAISSTQIRNGRGSDNAGNSAREDGSEPTGSENGRLGKVSAMNAAETEALGTEKITKPITETEKSAIGDYRVPEKMKRTWQVELAMLDEVDRICRKHDLQYFLVHGSLLGAVRHRGFIPWDDDLDIAMPRKDYDRFLELAGQELPEPLSVHTPATEEDLFWGGYARIRNSRTTAIEPKEMEHRGNLGIWIDVLPMDICTLDEKRFGIKEKRICHCQWLLYAKIYGRDYRAFCGLKPWRWRWYRLLAGCRSHASLAGQLESAQRMYTDEESDQVAFFTGMGKYRRLSAVDFKGTASLEFAGRKVPVPAGYENYLFALMGRDYMKYPPEEERRPKHRGIYDPERPYTEYVNMLCDTFSHIKGKKIILFGAGLMFEDYMKKYGDRYRPAFLVDNDENKWGRSRMGIPIREPKEILEVPVEKRRLIICSYYYREISTQLEEMGIHDYKVYVQEMEWILRTEEQRG